MERRQMRLHAFSERWGPEAHCRRRITPYDADLFRCQRGAPARFFGAIRAEMQSEVLSKYQICLKFTLGQLWSSTAATYTRIPAFAKKRDSRIRRAPADFGLRNYYTFDGNRIFDILCGAWLPLARLHALTNIFPLHGHPGPFTIHPLYIPPKDI
ncbi:hypothetical protein C8R43DRAFT_373229 [Mycena crocata]|nr:hypothetical protein C8R43DRAFT_373229 [Mycena crocata]